MSKQGQKFKREISAMVSKQIQRRKIAVDELIGILEYIKASLASAQMETMRKRNRVATDRAHEKN